MTRGLALACLLALALAPAPAHAAKPKPTSEQGARVAIDDRIDVIVPPDMTRDSKSLGARGDLLTLADGSDIVTIAVYRKATDKSPSVADALEIHAHELETALAPTTRHTGTRRALNREHRAINLVFTRNGVERDAWIFAFESLGRTIVVSTIIVRGSPNVDAFAAILDTIRAQ